jgi:asparagine synthase (glutamine-hydrolysing)
MRNEDASVLAVFNGEIWNHLELRRQLQQKGHRFATRCDTEVLVHGYEEWGDRLPSFLNGMFAFAIWDTRRERLLLARDRLGKKPLYVTDTPAGLVFGSDIRSVILAGAIHPELDRELVPEFLFSRYIAGTRTLVRGVRRVEPGSLLVHEEGRSRERSYWSLEPGEIEPLDPQELRRLLREAVRLRLMSDVPIGVLLSGGVDSAAVLGLMREAGAEDVASFTIGFNDPVFDERPAARATAEAFQTDHHEIAVGPDALIEALPRLAWYRDEPVAEPSEVPLLFLSELVGRHVKVVLSGDGADELFGGYPKYRAERLLRTGLVPGRLLSRLAGRVAGRATHRRLDRAFETLSVRDETLRWASWFRSFSPAELHDLVTPELSNYAEPTRLVAPLAETLAPFASLDRGRRMLVGDLKTYLPDNMLLRGDKVLMASSVEGRMPLLDYRVVERVSAAPLSARAGLRSGKTILRDAVRGLVPESVLLGPRHGFPVPVARLLANKDRLLHRLLLDERALNRGLLEGRAVARLLNPDAGVPDRELKLFTLVSFELWVRTNVDEVCQSPSRGWAELIGESADVDQLRAGSGRR